MRKSVLPTVMVNSFLEPLVVVRCFGWGRVAACHDTGRLAIVFMEAGKPEHTLFAYDDPDEFNGDLIRVLTFSSGDGDGEGGAGVPAQVSPSPPSRTAGYEETIPDVP